MTEAERKLLLAVADAVLTMARLRSPPMSTKELEAAWAEHLNERRVSDCLSQVRETLDEEAHRVVLCAGSEDRLAVVEGALHRMAEALRPVTARPKTISIKLPLDSSTQLRRPMRGDPSPSKKGEW